MLGDPLFLGLTTSVVLGVFMTASDGFAAMVRWRSGIWTLFCGFVTASFYSTDYLVGHSVLTVSEAAGIPMLRTQILEWVNINWLTSAAFVLGMVALTLAFSGQQHEELLAVKKACKWISPLLFAVGFLLPVIQFLTNLLAMH